jgi:hypothetical protein
LFWSRIYKMGLKLIEIVSIKSNGTQLIVGEMVDLYFPGEIWEDNGIIDIEKAGTIAGSSLDGYHTTQLIKRMKYAKP